MKKFIVANTMGGKPDNYITVVASNPIEAKLIYSRLHKNATNIIIICEY